MHSIAMAEHPPAYNDAVKQSAGGNITLKKKTEQQLCGLLLCVV